MGKPAARIGDNHVCLMLDGPKPHVGGVVLPPGTPTVLIGGLPAATMGDLCLCVCVSPIPNSIVMGSLGVLIGGRPAARMFDKTLHGGTIVKGALTVLIGEMSAVAGPAIFPGKQSHNNCGVQTSQQLIRQLTGVVHAEQPLLDAAVAAGLAHNGVNKKGEFDPYLYGRTSGESCQALLAGHGVVAAVVLGPQEEDLASALRAGKGVLAAVDQGLLYGDEPSENGHAVLVYDGDFDGEGNLTHVYLNDTGAEDPALRQGRCVPISGMMAALDGFLHPRTGEPLAVLVVTEAPLWTSTPIDLNPPRPSGLSAWRA